MVARDDDQLEGTAERTFKVEAPEESEDAGRRMKGEGRWGRRRYDGRKEIISVCTRACVSLSVCVCARVRVCVHVRACAHTSV